MDYYEELGLDRTASPEEIRRVYKRLVRLVHPDRCSDDAGRKLADLQMKRLNGVLAVLTNPADRANYNRGLALGTAVGPGPRLPSWHKLLTSSPWLFGMAMGAGLLGLAVTLSHIPQATRLIPEAAPIATTPAPPQHPEPSGRPPRSRSRLVSTAARPIPRIAPSQEMPRAAVPEAVWVDPPAPAPLSLTLEMPQAGIETPKFPAPAPPRTLSGEWLYVPSSRARKDGLYPPEYIELRVTEESGIVHGRYRARYRIADKAISPTVSFQFEGPAESGGGRLPWHGIGGSKGEVSLRLLQSGAMEVNWTATQLGEELGLISGTATLVRRLN